MARSVRRLIVRVGLAAASLWLADRVLVDLELRDPRALAAAAGLLVAAHAIVRPALLLLTLPVTVLTLGLSLLVVNAVMLFGVAWAIPGFRLEGWVAPLLGALVVSAGRLIGDQMIREP